MFESAMLPDGKPWVFISYAKEDQAAAQRLYRRLSRDGLRPWLDEHDLLPGFDWDHHIRNAIRQARFFVVLVSSHSINKRGYVNKEISEALDVAETMPEGSVYVVPARLDDSPVPSRLCKWQWINMFGSGSGYQQLKKSLVRHLGAEYVQPVAPPKPALLPTPPFGNPADALVYKSAEQAGCFTYCTLADGRRVISNRYWMQIRGTVPRSFASLKQSCERYGRMSAQGASRIIADAMKGKTKSAVVETIKVYDSRMYVLESKAGCKCYVNRHFLNIALETYPDGVVLVSGPTDPVLVRVSGEPVFILMPIRMESDEKE